MAQAFERSASGESHTFSRVREPVSVEPVTLDGPD